MFNFLHSFRKIINEQGEKTKGESRETWDSPLGIYFPLPSFPFHRGRGSLMGYSLSML
jgi:hypothetical protein